MTTSPNDRLPLDSEPLGCNQTYVVACVSTADGMAALQREWNEFAGDQVFVGWDWCDCWWRHYRHVRSTLWVLTVRDQEGRLIGLAPWVLRQTLTQGRVVRFIGSNEVCGDRLTIVASPRHRAAVTGAIANWLMGPAAESWDLLEFTGVEATDPSMTELVARLQSRGHAAHLRQGISCWRVELPRTWEDYLKMISKQRRVRVRKMLREKLDVGLATHRESQTEAELARDFERLIELHQKRRNMVGEPGCFASRTFTAFHVEFARRMLAQNKLYLSVTEMDGVPAAVGYDFVCGTSMYHYQSGFEPAFADERPGWLNLAATLRWAIERGITHFDMLRGDEPYKASFAAQSVPLVEIRVAGRRASAVLRHAAWRTQIGVKRIVRQGMSRAASWNRKANPPWVAPGIARESVVAAPTRAKPPVAPTI